MEEFFWRVSLSARYSSSTESALAQDIKRIEQILNDERPNYDDIKINLSKPEDLIKTDFRASSSFCKAILCLLASHEPKDFQSNSKVILDNSWLKVENSKNFHHFFPKKYCKNENITNANSLMNITFVSDHMNKRKIGSNAPSIYIGQFAEENEKIEQTLSSHLIGLNNFGIESNDYDLFKHQRAKLIYKEIKDRLELSKTESLDTEIHELILNRRFQIRFEFKSTLRFDINKGEVNKKLEFIVAKTIAAFLNSDGGWLLLGLMTTRMF